MAKKNVTVSLEGFAELNTALRSVGDRAGGIVLKNAAEAGAEVIAADARQRAPKRTGALARGIRTQLGRSQVGRAQVAIGIGKAEWYGALVERGTKFIPAKPFLRPALDTKSEEATDKVGESLRDALKDVL